MNWLTVKLGDICKFVYGDSLPQQNRISGCVAVYGSNGIVGEHNSSITNGETIIIGRKGSVGQVNWSKESCYPIDTTYYIDKDSTDQNLRWLFWHLKTLKLSDLNKAAAVPGLNRDDAYRLKISLPPIEEQRRIAALLDTADNVLCLREQAITKFEEIESSLFNSYDLLANKSFMLGEISEIVSGATPKTDRKEFWNGDICWITPREISDLTDWYISDTERKITKLGMENSSVSILPENSVLFSSRAPIGHVAINKIPLATNQGFKSFVVKKEIVDPVYLYYWLRSRKAKLQSLGVGATFKEVSKGIVASVEIKLPELKTQQKFVDEVLKIRFLKLKNIDAKSSMIKLIGSLQHQSFPVN